MSIARAAIQREPDRHPERGVGGAVGVRDLGGGNVPRSENSTIPRRRFLLSAFCFLLFVPGALFAQTDDGGFRYAVPGWRYEFPRDHGSHDEFRTEWWYYTGHLRASSGKRYGFEVTFFRVGVKSSEGAANGEWDLRNLALAHFAITDLPAKEFRYHEKLNRQSRYTAGSATGRMAVFNEAWRTEMLPDGRIRLLASAGDDGVDLVLTSRKAPAIHGEEGISVKAQGVGYASHYYSLTRLEASGTIRSGGLTERCSGTAWMDHEFGSSRLREHQAGWDWFSIQLDNDVELMIYVIRTRDGRPDVTSSGSLVLADGRVVHLRREDFRVSSSSKWKSPRSGATYPLGWRVELPQLGVDLRLRELLREQELVTAGSTGVTYWEGAVDISGRFGSTAVSGVGYVEMTGYDKPFRN